MISFDLYNNSSRQCSVVIKYASSGAKLPGFEFQFSLTGYKILDKLLILP